MAPLDSMTDFPIPIEFIPESVQEPNMIEEFESQNTSDVATKSFESIPPMKTTDTQQSKKMPKWFKSMRK